MNNVDYKEVMMKHILFYSNILIGIALILLMVACQNRLNKSLDCAGDNCIELEEVLHHYKNDKQKLQAARFLIENMALHGCYESAAIASFYADIDSLHTHYSTNNVDFFKKSYDMLLRKYQMAEHGRTKKKDIEHLKADYLIAHIDSAFNMWKASWTSEYGFEHFCDYVLPYRVGEEPISDWRADYVNKYISRVNGHPNCQRGKYHMYGVFSALNSGFFVSTYYPPGKMPEFSLSFLAKVSVDNCVSSAARSVALFRSLGLPAAVDFLPVWGNRSMGHSWAVFLPNEYTSLPFGANEAVGNHFYNRSTDKMPKAFRQMYRYQTEIADLYRCNEFKPELFQTPYLKDVTDLYVHTVDVEVSLFPQVKSEWVYLAVFDNSEWQAVHYAKRKGGKAMFKKMGCDIVYLPVYWDEYGEMLPAGHPFVLYGTGLLHILKGDKANEEAVCLKRKYRLSDQLYKYCQRTVGGRFQFANQEDFSDAVTIATIPSFKDCCFQELVVDCKEEFRYFRYMAPNGSTGEMAEIEMYDIQGVQPTIKRMFGKAEGNIIKLFDNDVLSYYNAYTNKDVWAAVEFDTPVALSSIRFLPRNDDNFIREGERYQIYYWDGNDWSLIQDMQGNREGVIHVDNVPRNALLLLHNATKGIEERIFTYENGEQVWW